MIKYLIGKEIKTYEEYKNCEKIYLIKYDDFGEILKSEKFDTTLTEKMFEGFLNCNKIANCKIYEAIKQETFVFSKEKDKKILDLISEYFDSYSEEFNVSFMKKLNVILEDK